MEIPSRRFILLSVSVRGWLLYGCSEEGGTVALLEVGM